jgi:hypothetical protein
MTHWRTTETNVIAEWLAREDPETVFEIVKGSVDAFEETKERNPGELGNRMAQAATLMTLANRLERFSVGRWSDGMSQGTLRDLVNCALGRVDWKGLAAHWIVRYAETHKEVTE